MIVREMSPQKLLGRELNQVETKNSPNNLYISGVLQVPLKTPRCAIVGTREPSQEGRETARSFSGFLARNGIIVISGLAKGIDSEAHKGAIEASGHTIAVLGTPLNKFYPKENTELQKEIMERHLAVSQFKTDRPVRPENFILRNRTMALLCDASVIIEAGDSSGTLSQGWEALRLGRPLFIFDSVFKRKDLEWPDKMIKYGAIKLDDFSSILDCLLYNDSNSELLEL